MYRVVPVVIVVSALHRLAGGPVKNSALGIPSSFEVKVIRVRTGHCSYMLKIKKWWSGYPVDIPPGNFLWTFS